MAEDLDALKIANDSGSPLQIAVNHEVTRTSKEHGWTVHYTEHAWVNQSDDQSGFIDLVLRGPHGAHLVIECKRVRDATWVFMHPEGVTTTRRRAKFWVSRYADGQMRFFDWYDAWVDPTSSEALFCAVRGQPTDGRKPDAGAHLRGPDLGDRGLRDGAD